MSQPMNRATILNKVYTMQADTVANAYAALAAENERLKADASDGYLLQSFLKWKGMQDEYQEWLDWRSDRPSQEGGAK